MVLQKASQAMSEHLYSAPGGAPGGGEGPGAAPGPGANGGPQAGKPEDVIDVEFEEKT